MGIGHVGTYRSRLVALAAAGLVLAGCDLGEPPIETGLSLEVSESRAGDLDGDGDLDLVHAVIDGEVIAWRLEVVLNDGSGAFTAVPQPVRYWQNLVDIEVADVTGDGVADLLTSSSPGAVQVDAYPGDGQGGFAAQASDTVPAPTDGPGEIAVGDVDGDGDLDLATVRVTDGAAGPSSSLDVASNDGVGGYGAWASTPQGEGVGLLEQLTDVDGDRTVDALVNYIGGPSALDLLPGDGAGGFGPAERWDAPTRDASHNVSEVELADIDGDGALDYVADTTEGAVVVYRDEPGFTVHEFGPRGRIAVADVDGDGRPDVLVGSKVFVNHSDPR